MIKKYAPLFVIGVCASLFLLPACFSQQGADQPTLPAPKKVLTPQQQEYQREEKQYWANRQSLQVQAKQIFDAEVAREKAGDCRGAGTTYESNVCFGKQLTTTDQNFKNFDDIIRRLQADPPQMPDVSEGPTTGPGGPILSQEQLVAEFDQVEQAWGKYRESACQAAFRQFAGGTGGPSFEMQCQLKLARNHMRELDMIYGVGLHR
jgi:uncharacterized protein YecT (DUF1311 family)